LLVNYYRLEPKEKLVYLQQKVKQMQKLPRKFYSSIRQPLLKADHKSPLQQAHEQADRDYMPQVYPGRAIVFRATDQPIDWLEWRSVGPQLGWDRLVAGGLEIQEVPGHHFNMFNQPYVQVLAEKLKACLDSTQADN
jgi:aspartate racemase